MAKKNKESKSSHPFGDLIQGPKRAFEQLATSKVQFSATDPMFLPYACHYDNNSILTKNGELFQVIKLTGLASEAVNQKNESISSLLQKAIGTYVLDNSYALYLHVIRKKRSVYKEYKWDNPFSEYLDKQWNKSHTWDNQYVNEVFLTIIHQGDSFNLRSTAFTGFFKKYHAKKSLKNLKKSKIDLDKTTNNLLNLMESFGALKLGLYWENNQCYSEIINFLSKITNLTDEPRLFHNQDLSEYIPCSKIAVGNNTIEIDTYREQHFSSLLSVKDYNKVTPDAIDKFLNLPIEFVITQTLDFVNAETVFKSFEYQRYILAISGSAKFAKQSGIDNIAYKKSYTATTYGESQLTIMVIAESYDRLNQDLKLASKSLASYGILSIAEDFALAPCFWSQLPANFRYITRKIPIDIDRFGVFSAIYNYPEGKATQNHWNDYVTVLPTEIGTPYFFNFHYEKQGNTLIIGPYGSGKSVVLNFLIAMSRKFEGNLFFFDYCLTSEITIKSLGGKYYVFNNQDDPIDHPYRKKEIKMKLNPLSLSDNKENREFLVRWLYSLTIDNRTNNESEAHISNETRETLQKVLAEIFHLPLEERSISKLSGLLLNTKYHEALKKWYNDGIYAEIFDHYEDDLSNKSKVVGFDVTHLTDNPDLMVPIASYLLHKIKTLLDGTPTIIVFDEAWDIVNNELLAEEVTNLIQKAAKTNAILIFASEPINPTYKSNVINDIIDNITTEIYLPNQNADSSYKELYKLSDIEFDKLSKLDVKNRQFLLKHNKFSLITKLDLDDISDVIPILSSDYNNIYDLYNVLEEIPNNENPYSWFQYFTNAMRDKMHYQESSMPTQLNADNIDLDDYQNEIQESQQKNIKETISHLKKHDSYSIKEYTDEDELNEDTIAQSHTEDTDTIDNSEDIAYDDGDDDFADLLQDELSNITYSESPDSNSLDDININDQENEESDDLFTSLAHEAPEYNSTTHSSETYDPFASLVKEDLEGINISEDSEPYDPFASLIPDEESQNQNTEDTKPYDPFEGLLSDKKKSDKE